MKPLLSAESGVSASTAERSYEEANINFLHSSFTIPISLEKFWLQKSKQQVWGLVLYVRKHVDCAVFKQDSLSVFGACANEYYQEST